MNMTPTIQTRSYEEMVEALAEGLQAVEDTLSGLSGPDWERPTLLRPPDPEAPPWDVLPDDGLPRYPGPPPTS